MKIKTLFNLPAALAGVLTVTSEVKASVVLPLAQATSSLKTSVQTGLGVVFLFGFIWGVINIWGGAQKLKHGDADGKMGIVSGIIIAGAAAIMTALFTIFGLGDGALTPSF
jgi:fumarate reductase subunit D